MYKLTDIANLIQTYPNVLTRTHRESQTQRKQLSTKDFETTILKIRSHLRRENRYSNSFTAKHIFVDNEILFFS